MRADCLGSTERRSPFLVFRDREFSAFEGAGSGLCFCCSGRSYRLTYAHEPDAHPGEAACDLLSRGNDSVQQAWAHPSLGSRTQTTEFAHP